MMDWRPSSGPRAAATRARMLGRVRSYFQTEGVLEVDTPALSAAAVSDTQIESLEIPSSAVSRRTLFLHTSPEFAMKRLLAAGYPDIFSVCRVFRDGEAGCRHQPEFTMIEWYRHGYGLGRIVADTVALIGAALGARRPDAEPVAVDYFDAITAATGIAACTAPIATLADAAGADERLREVLGDQRDDWLDLVLATRVIPAFRADRLTVLQHYPASQAALARPCPGNPAVADRFEIFLGPMELANGYVELTDAAEQRRRIERDNVGRSRRRRPVRPVDEAFLAALDEGLPECAGVALGLERLQMIHDNADDIRDVITFAFDSGS